ncbi:MAG: hypothetical protein QOJ00_246 [Actinomycetota bacterium]
MLVVGAVGMTMIVLADNNNWTSAWSLAAVFAFCVYLLGTLAFRVRPKGPGVVEVNTMLGLLKVDLRNGYTVKRGHLGRTSVVVRAGRKRYRLNGALGDIDTITAFFDAARQ